MCVSVCTCSIIQRVQCKQKAGPTLPIRDVIPKPCDVTFMCAHVCVHVCVHVYVYVYVYVCMCMCMCMCVCVCVYVRVCEVWSTSSLVQCKSWTNNVYPIMPSPNHGTHDSQIHVLQFG